MKIDAIARQAHFVDHILPLWLALPAARRGIFYAATGAFRPGVPKMVPGKAPPSRNPTLVAASGDLLQSRKAGRPTAIMEHGCGQSFGGDRRSANHSSYAGGQNRDAQLFLHPGPHPAARDHARYPAARVEIVGCPKLEFLPHKSVPSDKPVLAVSFHWNCKVSPETKGALSEFAGQVGTLARMADYTLLGHGHPRVMPYLAPWYEKKGIEVVRSFEEVCRRADLYINDASSTLFEFASTDRPVVVLNPGFYRRNIHHGLRFWEASTVGMQVGPSDSLVLSVRKALRDPPAQRMARETALDLVYRYRTGAAKAAASALVKWADSLA